MTDMEDSNSISIEYQPPPGSSDGSQHGASGTLENGDAKPASNETARAIRARKRTKTGCLTCRKRRIKCGEERPTCANCVKSRRSCEGYAPRLTFRDPLSAIVPGWAVREHYNIPTGNGVAGQVARSANGSQLPAILPRPMPISQLPLPQAPPSQIRSFSKPAANGFQPTANGFNVPTTIPEVPPPRLHESYHGQPPEATQGSNSVTTAAFAVSASQPPASHYPMENGLTHQATYDPQWLQHPDLPPPVQEHDLNQLQFFHQPIDHVPEQSIYSGTQYSMTHVTAANIPHLATPIDEPAVSLPAFHVPNDQSQSAFDYQSIPYTQEQHEPWAEARVEEPSIHVQATGAVDQHRYHYTEYDAVPISQADVHKLQDNASAQPSFMAVQPEDDPWDVVTDEEDNDRDTRIAATPQNDLGLMLALSASRDDTAPRSFTTFLDQPNVLARYIPRFNASPLMDATTARIFCHFITSTGPTLSIYERHPANPMLMFSGAPVPASQQALWTYTLPMMALANQALLHAMLGLASLHIARLQNSSLTASLRHYHYAIRRIAKAVATPSHRVDIATIAATLILSFYEAGTAEHSKWNCHLTGARQLLMEIDFKGQTRRIKEEKARMEADRTSTLGSLWYGNPIYSNYSKHIASQMNDVDEMLISKLMGWRVRYDEFGRIIDGEPEKSSKRPLTPKDVERYKILCDLFWWYCKQDVYQSVVSGNRLLLPHSRWGHCPPRAPIGRFNATYGTMDHLILLMGRVADFSSRDQMRKRKAVKVSGGQWRPPPGMFPGGSPGPPAGTQGPLPSMPPPPPTNAPPPMYGMMPAMPPPQLPDAFRSAPRDQLYFAAPMSEDDIVLENATKEAEAEWEEISKALELFEASLGEEFQPLSPDIMPPTQTPFGDSIEYRTYPIACIWTMFYTGCIITARMHPSMPPAAMMAAGIAASKTRHWAQLIGRICAGLQPPPSSQPLNPSLGAALMESSLGLFFAGVQYQDHAQRSYIVHILRRITVLTGWSSSALIAAGCEVTWIKTYEAGRGPPYQRTKDISEVDDRTNASMSDGAESNSDRSLIEINPGIRVHYAMGIMSVEEDFKEMSLSDRR